MAHLQHMPGDPRLVDLLVYELKSKGIFDQFRKECIADVDTRPAYQNLRQRVETSVSTFLSRQCWQPDLNKNQLREKLRKHLLDGNYLEQGVERIVDQVVNPKVASVFIPKVEDLVYNYLGITRKKSVAETSKLDGDNLLPTDLEAVSPGSVKSEGKNDEMDTSDVKTETAMDIDEEKPNGNHVENKIEMDSMSLDVVIIENDSIDKSTIPLPTEGIKLETIPHPENSPPMIESSHIELEKIELPKNLTEPVLSEIPLPNDAPKNEKDNYFKPINTDDDDDSSSDSSIRRNMSPLTPIRNYNNENSCDAQQAFDDTAETKTEEEDKKEPNTFRFTIEAKSPDKNSESVKNENKDTEKNLSFQFTNQVNINTFNTPAYDDSSNSNNLQIDYESDANSKVAVNNEVKIESEQNSEDSKKDKKLEEKKPSSHKSSHRSRDSHRHSSSKDRRSDSKHSSSRDSSKHDKNKTSSKDESKSKSLSTNNKDSSSKEKSDKKDRDSSSSRHRSSHKSSSSNKDSKSSHKSTSSSSNRHSSKSDDKKSTSSSSKDKEKERSSDKDKNKERSSKDSKSSSHRSSKEDRKKSSSSSSGSKRHDEKDKDKKPKKETDDHYSLSGRGNHTRRSTDRDSNDGSSSSKGSHNVPSSKSSSSKKESKSSSSKSEHTSTASDTSPSDKEKIVQGLNDASSSVKHQKSAVRVDTRLETPIASPARLPFVPEITLKKPKIASNMEEAKKIMKMRKFLDDEQKRMNQEAALLLEFQANVRPSLSQVYSSIPGPELEFACVMSSTDPQTVIVTNNMDNNIIENQEMVSEDKEETVRPCSLSVEQQLENIYAATYGNQDGYVNTSGETSFESQSGRTMETSINDDYYTEINVSIEEDNSETVEEIPADPEVMDNTQLENILGDSEEKQKESVESVNQYNDIPDDTVNELKLKCPEELPFKFFNESEKYNAELERDGFSKLYKTLKNKSVMGNKMFLINCDSYEESIFNDISKTHGDFEVVNYFKNGHLKLPSASKGVVKDMNIGEEISIPLDTKEEHIESPIFSPVKSECSFDLTDYHAKLDESVKQKSRQQIMEIILGNIEESPSKMPEINYCNESSIESSVDNNLKRKLDFDTSTNNNTHVLTPNKMRKVSESEQITSTTEEMAIETATNKVLTTSARSKYLGKARRVGLPRPRKSNLQNSPSSDKSIENYEQNPATPQNPNCKITQPRTKIQRYDTSDLYKPKLHYLSRRNHVT